MENFLAEIIVSCRDHWAGFNKIIPSTCLFQGKDKTFCIEQNNAQNRHWFARFCRPPCKLNDHLKCWR
ncbi:IS1 transposase [Holospora elegans]|uniref:IS1 transposase n=1 Tax=Holospora elegans TaxID=431043 RepID=UPI00069604A3|nr:IS1 transposase [Holospora elegans]